MTAPIHLEPTIFRFSYPCDDQRSGVRVLGLTKPDQRKAARRILWLWLITTNSLWTFPAVLASCAPFSAGLSLWQVSLKMIQCMQCCEWDDVYTSGSAPNDVDRDSLLSLSRGRLNTPLKCSSRASTSPSTGPGGTIAETGRPSDLRAAILAAAEVGRPSGDAGGSEDQQWSTDDLETYLGSQPHQACSFAALGRAAEIFRTVA